MLTSKMVRFSAVALVGFACMLATEARAQIFAAQTAPLSCTVPLGSGTLTVQAGADGLSFPHDVPCPGGTATCSEYNYKFTSSNGSSLTRSFLSISSDLDIYAVSPSAVIENPVCSGDFGIPLIGRFVCEQRTVRFGSQPSGFSASVIVNRAAPRVATAGAFSGLFNSGFCLIQGPGVPGGAFKPYASATKLKVAGGKLDVSVDFGADGLPVGGQCLSGAGTTCFTGSPVGDLTVNGEVLRDFEIVTFGDNTSTCLKGNPTRCFCTQLPCP